MPVTKRRALLEIQSFIRKRLPVKLCRDLKYLRIVKEADVECAAYHHLRDFISESRRWRVLARKHVPHTGHYVDLLIFKDYRPAIAIELKWGQTSIGKKDRHSLTSSLQKLAWEQLVSGLSILNLALRVEMHQLVSEFLRIKSPDPRGCAP